MTDNVISIEVFPDGTINPSDLLAAQFSLTFPAFSNNDDILCPLKYRLSSTNDTYTESLILISPQLVDG